MFMRGHGSDAAVHITHKAEQASFIGFGLEAASEDDLKKFALAKRLPIEDYAEPGGGKVVRLESPEGCTSAASERVTVQAGRGPILTRSTE